jgi:hypothetical protein
LATLAKMFDTYARKIRANPILFAGLFLSAISFAASISMLNLLIKDIDEENEFQISLSSRVFIGESASVDQTITSEPPKGTAKNVRPQLEQFGVAQGDRDDPNPRPNPQSNPWPGLLKIGSASAKKDNKGKTQASESREGALTEIATLRSQMATLGSQLESSQAIVGRLVTKNSQLTNQLTKLTEADALQMSELSQKLSNVELRIDSQRTFTERISILTVLVSFSTGVFIAISSIVGVLSYKRGTKKDGVPRGATVEVERFARTRRRFD